MTNNTPHNIHSPLEQALAKKLASARNYLYEATMGDYSQASINRGQDHFNQLKQEALDLGLDYEDLATWSQERGCWVATA